MDITRHVHHTRDVVLIDGIEEAMTREGVDPPAINFTVVESAAGDDDFETGL